jgi:hypothetical protein
LTNFRHIYMVDEYLLHRSWRRELQETVVTYEHGVDLERKKSRNRLRVFKRKSLMDCNRMYASVKKLNELKKFEASDREAG